MLKEISKKVGMRIKQRRKELKISQQKLAELAGMASGSVGNYESGYSTPKEEYLIKIMEVLNCDANYLFQDFINKSEQTETTSLFMTTNQEQRYIVKYRACDERGRDIVDNVLDYEYNRTTSISVENNENSIVKIKVYNESASAGFGNYLFEDSYSEIEFPNSHVPIGTDFGVRIVGDSMQPSIPDKCIAFIKSRPAVENNKIGLFYLNGEGFCKRFKLDNSRRIIWLMSDNPKYDPIEVEPEDYLHVFGEVLGCLENGKSNSDTIEETIRYKRAACPQGIRIAEMSKSEFENFKNTPTEKELP